jgi:hypothetical protein
LTQGSHNAAYSGYGDPYGIWPFTKKAGSSDEPKFIGKAANTLLDIGAVALGTTVVAVSTIFIPFTGGASAVGVVGGLALASVPFRRGKAKKKRQEEQGITVGGKNLVETIYDQQRVADAMKVASYNARMAARQAGTSPTIYYAPPMQYNQPGPTALDMIAGAPPPDDGQQLAVPLIIGGVILAGIAAWVVTQKKR